MKTKRKLIPIWLLCVALLPVGVRAPTYPPVLTYTNFDGIWFYRTNNDGTATITGFSGHGDVVIPNRVYNMLVTSLGSVGYGNPNLHSVIIPDSVTSVEDDAFYECGLTSVIIPGSVTSIGNGAFYSCAFLTSVTIPDSATNLGSSIFNECGDLTNATIGDRVASIPNGMFYNCGLTSFTIPGSVTSIGNGAFEYCFHLANLTIPNSVNSIGDAAFYCCTALTNLTIPVGVTNIGAAAFGYIYDSMLFFAGNAPASIETNLFLYANNVTVYYLPGTTGWENFAQLTAVPVVLWNPQAQTDDGSFGVQNNQFGFNITGTTNIPVMVEATTDLTQPLWTPLFTVTVTNGRVYFCDPQGTNNPSRLYRLRSP